MHSVKMSSKWILALSILATAEALKHQYTSLSSTVDFTDARVQAHIQALVKLAQNCVLRVRAGPKDVRAYFTNSPPLTRQGECFTACMMEQSEVIIHGKINREHLIHLASLVNGKESRVVRKLTTISRMCLEAIENVKDRCTLASTYNDCLNENMMEFAFPVDIAEHALSQMPFHLMKANSDLFQNSPIYYVKPLNVQLK